MGHIKWAGAQRQAVKDELAARDGACCFYCREQFSAGLVDATFDHLMPYSLFPRNLRINLVLACGPCNRAKGDQQPHEFLKISVADLAARIGVNPAKVERVLAAPAQAPAGARNRVLIALRTHPRSRVHLAPAA